LRRIGCSRAFLRCSRFGGGAAGIVRGSSDEASGGLGFRQTIGRGSASEHFGRGQAGGWRSEDCLSQRDRRAGDAVHRQGARLLGQGRRQRWP